MNDVTADAIKFIQLLVSECGGLSDHDWRRCRRCLAINDIEGNFPLARRYLTVALEALRREAEIEHPEGEYDAERVSRA